MSGESWVRYANRDPAPRLRVFCFPYAGAGANVYRAWQAWFPEDVQLAPVTLPGREARFTEPAFTRLDALARETARGLRDHLDVPFAFFGHSMGALLAFEVTRRLRAADAPLPRHLWLSGHRAPRVPSRREPLRDATDARLVQEMRELGGMPAALLDDPDVVAAFAPVFRADVEACETYAPAPTPPLDVDVTAFAGHEDPVAPPDDVAAWADETRGRFTLRTFPGGHFFVHDGDAVARALAEDAARVVKA